MKIGIICSPGGHLVQALSIVDSFKGHDCFLVVQNFPNMRMFNPSEVKRTYRLKVFPKYGFRIKITPGHYIWVGVYLSLLWDMFELIKIFAKEKPEVLFSTGSEIAIPAFYIGKLFFSTKLIFLESITRLKEISFTGKVVMPLVDLFLVQWENLTRKYRRARFIGRVI